MERVCAGFRVRHGPRPEHLTNCTFGKKHGGLTHRMTFIGRSRLLGGRICLSDSLSLCLTFSIFSYIPQSIFAIIINFSSVNVFLSNFLLVWTPPSLYF